MSRLWHANINVQLYVNSLTKMTTVICEEIDKTNIFTGTPKYKNFFSYKGDRSENLITGTGTENTKKNIIVN